MLLVSYLKNILSIAVAKCLLGDMVADQDMISGVGNFP